MITVNIITYQNKSGLSNDIKILKNILDTLEYKVNIIDYFKYECPLSTINIFLEVITFYSFFGHLYHEISIRNPNQYAAIIIHMDKTRINVNKL